jgi:hypothetical protein
MAVHFWYSSLSVCVPFSKPLYQFSRNFVVILEFYKDSFKLRRLCSRKWYVTKSGTERYFGIAITSGMDEIPLQKFRLRLM